MTEGQHAAHAFRADPPPASPAGLPPALAWAVGEHDRQPGYGPDGWTCDGCPFAVAGPCDDDTLSHPFDLNRWGGRNANASRSEAWYRCGLPGSATAAKPAVWGEDPACTPAEWKAQARAELAGTTSPAGGRHAAPQPAPVR